VKVGSCGCYAATLYYASVSDYTVYKRDDSPFWWIAFPDASAPMGRRQMSSKKRRDNPVGYKQALDLARTLAEDAQASNRIATGAGWDAWVEAWIRDKFAEPRHARSLKAELHRWRWLRAFLSERKISTPGEVTYQLGLDFMEWRQKHKTRSGKGGYNNALGELRQLGRIMREAVRRGFVTASPLERMGLKRHKPKEKPEITDAQIVDIRRALAEREEHLPIGKRWMTVSFEIALHQGCRHAETSLPLANINDRAGTITLRQKGDRVFTTRLHDGLRPLIAELRAAGATVTCTHPPMAGKLWHWFFNGRKDRGHESKGVAPGLCFHCTRVTVITRMARAGVPIQQAMAYVGHADEEIHRIYQRLQAPDLSRVQAALDF
jgi:hypothetical protein